MEHQDDDIEELHDDMEELEEEEEEELTQTEFGAQEIEIETEQVPSPEEILPDIKSKVTVPPLRPLTIAPKPAKVPITFTGQQFLLVQGGSAGQPLKLMSPQGQGLNLANLSIGKPVTLRPAAKSLSTPTSISIQMQPKQIVMKKVLSKIQKPIESKQGQVLIGQKTDGHIKLIQSDDGLTSPAQPKTLSLAQAQQMGLLTGAKIVTQSTTKQPLVLNKAQTTKIVSTVQAKSPAKILPAPQTGSAAKVAQRIILKPASNSPTIVNSNQIIHVVSTQPLATGQVHQINIPGKGFQYIKFVTANSKIESSVNTSTVTGTKPASQIVTAVSKAIPLSGIISSRTTPAQVKPGNVVLSEFKTIGASGSLVPKTIKPVSSIKPAKLQVSSTGGPGHIVLLPTGYLSTPPPVAKVAIPVKSSPTKLQNHDAVVPNATDTNIESNGMRPRKPCNCTKSQCLKLYCDCFANGEFCYMCNCMNCYNNLENEEHRQRAIKSCLERNPNAFRPKIGKARDTGDSAIRKHTKGCNCKRSGCLKNYCECYEAKIACSNNCKCVGCRNIEDSMDKKSLRPQTTAEVHSLTTTQHSSKINSIIRDILPFQPRRSTTTRQAFNFVTSDVIEAMSQCLLTLSDSAEAENRDQEITEKQILEEFGRCLMEVIACSTQQAPSSG